MDWQAGDIVVVPMPVSIDGTVREEVGDTLDEPLGVALAEDRVIATSRPAPGRIEALYRSLERQGCEGIVSVHLSGLLSGTVDSARLAALAVDIPVEIVDSRTAGMAQGFGVLAANAAVRSAGTMERAAAEAAMTCRSSSMYVYVPSLHQLRKGGRVSGAAGWLGTMLSVKVLLRIDEGRLVPVERLRYAERALDRLAQLVAADLAVRPEGSSLAVHHFGDKLRADALAEKLSVEHPSAAISVTRCPAVLAAHTGLGVIAVAVASPWQARARDIDPGSRILST